MQRKFMPEQERAFIIGVSRQVPEFFGQLTASTGSKLNRRTRRTFVMLTGWRSPRTERCFWRPLPSLVRSVEYFVAMIRHAPAHLGKKRLKAISSTSLPIPRIHQRRWQQHRMGRCCTRTMQARPGLLPCIADLGVAALSLLIAAKIPPSFMLPSTITMGKSGAPRMLARHLLNELVRRLRVNWLIILVHRAITRIPSGPAIRKTKTLFLLADSISSRALTAATSWSISARGMTFVQFTPTIM